MKVNGKPQQTIWLEQNDPSVVCVIDQRALPHRFETMQLRSVEQAHYAIADMVVRGAPLIGVTAAFGAYLAAIEATRDTDFWRSFDASMEKLLGARPTAVNLRWALDEQRAVLQRSMTPSECVETLKRNAQRILDDDIAMCSKIGDHGVSIVEELWLANGKRTVNILTHCNAGWLCAVDWGTATAPIYKAFEAGIPIHVWVDETRPRNQGASLTAWELQNHGVPFTLIADNAGGHLMQAGKVDIVIVGTDRVARNGDVCNKIGTYLKALAAHDNAVPFYIGAPSSSIDWVLPNGRAIPIEERAAEEVTHLTGFCEQSGTPRTVRITAESTPVSNYGFDVTPARLVTALITERGIASASEAGLLELFPEKRVAQPL